MSTRRRWQRVRTTSAIGRRGGARSAKGGAEPCPPTAQHAMRQGRRGRRQRGRRRSPAGGCGGSDTRPSASSWIWPPQGGGDDVWRQATRLHPACGAHLPPPNDAGQRAVLADDRLDGRPFFGRGSRGSLVSLAIRPRWRAISRRRAPGSIRPSCRTTRLQTRAACRPSVFSFREGTAATSRPPSTYPSARDLRRCGPPRDRAPPEESRATGTGRQLASPARGLIEFMAAQPDGQYYICEDAEGPSGTPAPCASAGWRSSRS